MISPFHSIVKDHVLLRHSVAYFQIQKKARLYRPPEPAAVAGFAVR
jgi:hypothetical protein